MLPTVRCSRASRTHTSTVKVLIAPDIRHVMSPLSRDGLRLSHASTDDLHIMHATIAAAHRASRHAGPRPAPRPFVVTARLCQNGPRRSPSSPFISPVHHGQQFAGGDQYLCPQSGTMLWPPVCSWPGECFQDISVTPIANRKRFITPMTVIP